MFKIVDITTQRTWFTGSKVECLEWAKTHYNRFMRIYPV